ncbi:MAG: hypothetical protein N2485_02735 [bacterium]|nr:hypothetical protein [bacterium]
MKKLALFLILIFSFFIIRAYSFDCKYFSFELPGNQNVKVNDNGVYVEGSEGKVIVDDTGVKVYSQGNTNWILIDNRNRISKEGDYYVLFQHNKYKVNLKVTFYTNLNSFYSGYNDFINKIKLRESSSDIQITKTIISSDYSRIVYKIVVQRDNGTKSIYYTISSDEGFYTIEFSGKNEYVLNLANDLKYVLDTFICKV